MKHPRVLALLIVLACVARSPATAEQLKRAEALTIGVAVHPTCTVAVSPGETEPEEAIKLACRNLRQSQPAPLLLEAEPRDGHEVVLIRF
jgi:hypothetical protein